MKVEDFPLLAENAMKDACGATNPHQPTKEEVIQLFQDAYDQETWTCFVMGQAVVFFLWWTSEYNKFAYMVFKTHFGFWSLATCCCFIGPFFRCLKSYSPSVQEDEESIEVANLQQQLAAAAARCKDSAVLKKAMIQLLQG